MNAIFKAGVTSILLTCAGSLFAAETIAYTYDAKGRLIKVVKRGTVNNGVKAEYTHDKTDNRTEVLATGAP